MLGPGRLIQLTGLAGVLLLIEDVVIVLAELLDFAPHVLLGDFAGGGLAALVVDPEAEEGEYVGDDYICV